MPSIRKVMFGKISNLGGRAAAAGAWLFACLGELFAGFLAERLATLFRKAGFLFFGFAISGRDVPRTAASI